MSDIAIKIENIGKRYRYGGVAPLSMNLREDLTNWAKGFLRSNNKHHPSFREVQEAHIAESPEYFWALKDINLEVKQGEVIGIIGRNGAGKSTLLKILSRITWPTTGKITYHGRVSSLLEVGTGFHRELTGRENVFLNGSILGMRRSEIAKKFDEIVAFSELEKFIDTPVKFYSSGMYVRLAFGVAAHLETDIMVVDEVLSVGDAAFRKKSMGKMEDVAKKGRTVLFVSHQMSAIRTMTQKCVYLKDGKIITQGPTEPVVRQYLSSVLGYEGDARPPLAQFHRDSASDSPVRFTRVWVNDAADVVPILDMGQEFTIHAEIENKIELRGAVMGIEIRRDDGTNLTTLYSADQNQRPFLKPGRHVLSCQVRNLPTTPGDYQVLMGINQSEGTKSWDVVMDYPLFKVADQKNRIVHWPDRPWGAVHWNDVTWDIGNRG